MQLKLVLRLIISSPRPCALAILCSESTGVCKEVSTQLDETNRRHRVKKFAQGAFSRSYRCSSSRSIDLSVHRSGKMSTGLISKLPMIYTKICNLSARPPLPAFFHVFRIHPCVRSCASCQRRVDTFFNAGPYPAHATCM